MKIYVASSWRNEYYLAALHHLRGAGHTVWDWKSPPTGGSGFRWQDTGETSVESYSHGDKVNPTDWFQMLRSPVAMTGFASDLAGMNWCDAGVLLLPAGRSAHLEAGWIAGRGKKVHLLCPEDSEPDLMVLTLGGSLCINFADLIHAIARG